MNSRDAANYLIRLYYCDNRECTSSSVQKLLVIAQLYSLYVYNEPLFKDDLKIIPFGFAVPIILDTYSDNIFAKGQLRTELKNDYNEYNEIIKKPNLSIEKFQLSSFYDIWYPITNEQMKLLDLIYCHFGAYSGRCIGHLMTELKIYNKNRLYKKVNIVELEKYIKNIPEEDKQNIIINFIENGEKMPANKTNYTDKDLIERRIIKGSKEVSVKLSDRTKANLEYFIGISLEEFNNLSAEEQDRFVEKQSGKKPTYSKNSYVDGYSIKTMDEVDKGINKIIKTGYVKRFIRKIKNSKQNK